MPYCPKCDMEFVEGITVCSDCGRPLMDREEAIRQRELEKQKAKTEETYPAVLEPENDFEAAPRQKEEHKAYVTKRQRYDDMKSSIGAFFMMGGIFLSFGILCLVNLVSLPLDKGPGMMFELVLTALGAGCLVVAAVTKKSANRTIKEAEAEESQTKELIIWYTERFNARESDEILLKEDSSLDENELYLRRFELIQDRLTTAHDLPDPSYVDFLSEEVYSRIFEKNN